MTARHVRCARCGTVYAPDVVPLRPGVTYAGRSILCCPNGCISPPLGPPVVVAVERRAPRTSRQGERASREEEVYAACSGRWVTWRTVIQSTAIPPSTVRDVLTYLVARGRLQKRAGKRVSRYGSAPVEFRAVPGPARRAP